MSGFIYVFTEGGPNEIEECRTSRIIKAPYKVGKTDRADGAAIRSVVKRLRRQQSCNPRPLGVVRAYEFGPDTGVASVEKSFHRHFEQYCVGLHGGKEWYRSDLLLVDAEKWLADHGGVDRTTEIPAKNFPGGYEEGPGYSANAARPRFLSVVLLHLQDGRDWWRVIATNLDRSTPTKDIIYKPENVAGWYSTGNYRPVRMVQSISVPVGYSNNAAWNTGVTNMMEYLVAKWSVA